MVGDVASDEVTAVKRVGWSAAGGRGRGALAAGSRPTARATIKLPEASAHKARKVDVLVVSDAYIGLEHRIAGVEIPPLPKADGDLDESSKRNGGEEATQPPPGLLHDRRSPRPG